MVPARILHRLYGEPPPRFVAARSEAVAEARAAGDPTLAREIAGLRKPTLAAWLVNLLALRRPELVDQLVELSSAMRSAQRDLRGPQLRELSHQRRQVVTTLVAAVRDLAGSAMPDASDRLPLAEVEATLTAALADPDVADQVRSGHLVRTTRYAGFGEMPRPQLRLVTGDESEPGGVTGSAGRERGRRSRLNRRLAAAQHQQERARSDLDRAVEAEREGLAELAEIDAVLAELRHRRQAAEERLNRARRARRTAERAMATARRETGVAQADVEALDGD